MVEGQAKDKRFCICRDELMQHGADHVTEFDYPDTWQQDNLLLP